MITLAQSLADLRLLLGEHRPVIFSDDDLEDWLDQGQKEVAALTLCYQQRRVYLDTDSPEMPMVGVRDYAINGPVGSVGLGIADSIRILHVWLNNDSLTKWTPDMVAIADARETTTGTPRFWYEFAGLLGLIPSPSAAFLATTYTLEVVYATYPPDWTSGESVLPSGFDELPTVYALVMAHLSRRRWADAALAYQTFIALAMQYRQISLALAATPQTAVKPPPRQERTEEPRRVVALRR